MRKIFVLLVASLIVMLTMSLMFANVASAKSVIVSGYVKVGGSVPSVGASVTATGVCNTCKLLSSNTDSTGSSGMYSFSANVESLYGDPDVVHGCKLYVTSTGGNPPCSKTASCIIYQADPQGLATCGANINCPCTADADCGQEKSCCTEGTQNIGTCYTSSTPEEGCCAYGSCYDGTHAPEKCSACYGGQWHSGWDCEGGECVPEASTLVLLATGLLFLVGYLGLRRKEN